MVSPGVPHLRSWNSNSAPDSALSRFKPSPQIDRPTVPSSPVPLFKLPKKDISYPRRKTFSWFCNAIRHETGSAATANCFAQRRGWRGRPYLAAALQVAVPRRSSAIPRGAGGARSTVRWSPPAQPSGRECPTTARPSPEPPFGSSLVFPAPRRPGELTRSAGIRDGTGLPCGVRPGSGVRSARGQLRPRVTCRLRAAAAAPAQGLRSRAPHCHPAPGAPCAL